MQVQSKFILVWIIYFKLVLCTFSSRLSGVAAVQQPTVAESFAKCVTYAPSSKQAQDLNKAVAYFISKDMMPFQIVEKPRILHLMKKAVTQYKVPTRSYFSTNKIPAMYKEVRASVEEQLAEGVVWHNHRPVDQPWWWWRTLYELYCALPLY